MSHYYIYQNELSLHIEINLLQLIKIMNNKPLQKNPEDLIYDEVDDYNRINFGKVAEQELSKVPETANNEVMKSGELNKYE